MNRKKMAFLLIISLLVFRVNALSINDCDVLASLKLQSSLDEDIYICKDKDYGKKEESIYYSKEDNTIYLNNGNIYYLSNYGNPLTISISGDNFINLLSLDSNITIVGEGNLKFKEDSYIKKTDNGEKVYRYVYDNRIIVNQDKKIYEGTLNAFAQDYNNLKADNTMPEEFKEEDYQLIPAPDYVNMIPISITPAWIGTYITTDLDSMVEDGYGLLKPKEVPKEEPKTEEKEEMPAATTLETEKVTLISSKKLEKKYKLKVADLSSKKEEYNSKITEGDILNLYDITIKKGKKTVKVKDNNYTIKIKLDSVNTEEYESYKVVYISDSGEVSEYINGEIEGDYVVFKTPHLSQYGVVGKKKVIEEPPKEEVKEKVIVKKKEDNSIILKVGILVIIAFISLILIFGLYIKSQKLNKRRTIKNK